MTNISFETYTFDPNKPLVERWEQYRAFLRTRDIEELPYEILINDTIEALNEMDNQIKAQQRLIQAGMITG